MRIKALHTFSVLIWDLPDLGLRPAGFPQFAIGNALRFPHLSVLQLAHSLCSLGSQRSPFTGRRAFRPPRLYSDRPYRALIMYVRNDKSKHYLKHSPNISSDYYI